MAANHFVGLLLWIPINRVMFTGATDATSDAELTNYAERRHARLPESIRPLVSSRLRRRHSGAGGLGAVALPGVLPEERQRPLVELVHVLVDRRVGTVLKHQ
jgi:hypothetical protein